MPIKAKLVGPDLYDIFATNAATGLQFQTEKPVSRKDAYLELVKFGQHPIDVVDELDRADRETKKG